MWAHGNPGARPGEHWNVEIQSLSQCSPGFALQCAIQVVSLRSHRHRHQCRIDENSGLASRLKCKIMLRDGVYLYAYSYPRWHTEKWNGISLLRVTFHLWVPELNRSMSELAQSARVTGEASGYLISRAPSSLQTMSQAQHSHRDNSRDTDNRPVRLSGRYHNNTSLMRLAQLTPTLLFCAMTLSTGQFPQHYRIRGPRLPCARFL